MNRFNKLLWEDMTYFIQAYSVFGVYVILFLSVSNRKTGIQVAFVPNEPESDATILTKNAIDVDNAKSISQKHYENMVGTLFQNDSKSDH